MIAGRKIELITQDTAGNPALAKTKTQELVERYKVPVMIGPLATNEALAMDGYVRDSKVPLITTTSAATVDLKSRAPNPYVLHAFGTAPQVTYPLGDYAAKTLGYKKIAIVAEDFTYGHEGAGGFHLAFEAAGGKIVQKLWPPLNAPEYGPYLAQIKPDVDAIYMGFAGGNPLRFLKQFTDFGLKGKIAVLGNTTSTDEGILKVMGEEAVGVYHRRLVRGRARHAGQQEIRRRHQRGVQARSRLLHRRPLHGAAHYRGGAQDHRRKDRRCRGLPQGYARCAA